LRDALEALRGALAADAGLKIIEVAKLTFSGCSPLSFWIPEEKQWDGYFWARDVATKELIFC
jgi:hypothetical protein